MSIKDKYHIDNQVWIDLIRNGVISCSVSKQEDILTCVKKYKDAGIIHCEAVKKTADDMRVTDVWVYEVLRRWGK